MTEQGEIGADEDLWLESLRADLPSAGDRERTRQRLAAAGVLALGTVSSATAAAASGNALAGVPAGLLQKIAAWSWTGKVALASVVCAGVSAPLAVHMLAAAPAAEVARLVHTQTKRVAAEKHAPPLAATASSNAPIDLLAPSARVGSARPQERLPAAPGDDPSEELPPAQARPQPLERAANPSELRDTRARPRPLGRSAAIPEAAVVLANTQPVERSASISTQQAERVGRSAEQTYEAAAPRAAGLTEPQPSAAEAAPRTAQASVFSVEPPRSGRAAPLRPRPSTLAEETKLIERALAALQVHDLAAARAWLSLHAARFHDGLLRRERESVWKRVTGLSDGTSR
jgi:hypothetical protein